MTNLTKSQQRNLDLLSDVGAVTRDEAEKWSVKGFHSTALNSLAELGLINVAITTVMVPGYVPRHLKGRVTRPPVEAWRYTYTAIKP